MTGTGSTGFSLRPSRQGGQGPEVQENPPGKVEVLPEKVKVEKNQNEKKVKVAKDIVPGYDSSPLLDCRSHFPAIHSWKWKKCNIPFMRVEEA